MSKNQSYFSIQSEKQEFVFPKKVSQEKIKSKTQDLTTANRFLVLARENASDFQPPSSTIDLQEQSCTRKETTSLRENMVTQKMIKKLINRIKICQKGMAIATAKPMVKRR